MTTQPRRADLAAEKVNGGEKQKRDYHFRHTESLGKQANPRAGAKIPSPFGFRHGSPCTTTVLHESGACYRGAFKILETLTVPSKVSRAPSCFQSHFHVEFLPCPDSYACQPPKALKWKSGKDSRGTWAAGGGPMLAGPGPCRPPGCHTAEGSARSPGFALVATEPHWLSNSAICHARQCGVPGSRGRTPHQSHQARGSWLAPGPSHCCQLIGCGEAVDLLSTEWLL